MTGSMEAMASGGDGAKAASAGTVGAAAIAPCLGTPRVVVLDGRGLAVARVDYNRRAADETVSALVERDARDAAGRVEMSRDRRLGAAAAEARPVARGVRPNLARVLSLSGRVLRRASADNGVRVMLADASGAEVLSLEHVL